MVANGVVVKQTDVAMQPLANFIQSLFGPCADFIKQCTKKPDVEPLPPPTIVDGVINKDLRNALKVVTTEIEKNFDKIIAKAKEDSNAAAQAALMAYRNPPKNSSKSRPAVSPLKSSGRHGFLHLKEKENEEEIQSPSVETPSSSSSEQDEAVAAAHRAFDDILRKYRGAVLSHTGENFSNVVNELEKVKARLKEEREQRKVAERMVVNLQTQVQELQKEIANLRASSSSSSSSDSKPSAKPTGISTSPFKPAGLTSSTTPVTPSASTEAKSKTRPLNMQSRLPCAAMNRQAIALLDEVLMLSARINRVPQVLYLARIVRELQRLIRTQFTEPFEFAKNITYNPSEGEDSNISFDDEKMHNLRRAIPECINKVRDWCADMLEDDAVLPTFYPSASLRIQNLVDLLRDVSKNLRSSIFS